MILQTCGGITGGVQLLSSAYPVMMMMMVVMMMISYGMYTIQVLYGIHT